MGSVWRLGIERVRELREQKGLSRPQLARRMGVRAEAVKNWETGKHKVTMDHLFLLATALECDPGQFFIKRQDEGLFPYET